MPPLRPPPPRLLSVCLRLRGYTTICATPHQPTQAVGRGPWPPPHNATFIACATSRPYQSMAPVSDSQNARDIVVARHTCWRVVSFAPLAQVCSCGNQDISHLAQQTRLRFSLAWDERITLPRLQWPHCTACAPALAPIPMLCLCEHTCPPAVLWLPSQVVRQRGRSG